MNLKICTILLCSNTTYNMVKIIIVKRDGRLNEKKTKTFDESEIYKYGGFKTMKDFCWVHSFELTTYVYKVYAKNKGKANNENKYELPPPIDTNLYFGNICILKYDKDGNCLDLACQEWEKVYEELFGGFEDIVNSEGSSTRSMDSVIYSDEEYTDEGYLKDGFVVDDNDELKEEEYLPYD